MEHLSLNDVLNRDRDTLLSLKQGTFTSEKLGMIAFSSLDYEENRQIKKDCTKMVPNGTGGMQSVIDDTMMILKVIIAAVDKDTRSDFTFASKQLLGHLGCLTADEAVAKLLYPGEILNFAMEIQDISGFGPRAKKEAEEQIKNS